MKKLLNFIDDLSYEPYHYWLVLDGALEWEVFFRKKNAPTSWEVKQKNMPSSLSFNTEDFYHYLNNKFPSTDKLKEKISETILTMSVFAYQFIDEAQKILGQEAIEEVVLGHAEFSKQLMEIVSEQIKKPSLKTIKS